MNPEKFCLKRVKAQIEQLNGDDNPPPGKVRRLTIDGLSCLIQMYEEQAEIIERLAEASKERNSWKYVFRDRILPNIITAILIGAAGWIALVNQHIHLP